LLIIRLKCVSNFLYSTGGAPKRRGSPYPLLSLSTGLAVLIMC